MCVRASAYTNSLSVSLRTMLLSSNDTKSEKYAPNNYRLWVLSKSFYSPTAYSDRFHLLSQKLIVPALAYYPHKPHEVQAIRRSFRNGLPHRTYFSRTTNDFTSNSCFSQNLCSIVISPNVRSGLRI